MSAVTSSTPPLHSFQRLLSSSPTTGDNDNNINGNDLVSSKTNNHNDVALLSLSSTTTTARQIMAQTFLKQSETKSLLSSSLGPLSQLHVSEHFAHDQLWQQVEFRNQCLISSIRRKMNNLTSSSLSSSKKKKENNKRRVVTFAPIPTTDDRNNNTDETDDVISHKKKKSKQESHASNSSNVETKEKDNFFNVADMNAFVNDAERLAEKGKLALFDDDEQGDSSSEEGNEEEDDDDDEDNGGGGHEMYGDFFDHPLSNGEKDKTAELLAEIEPSMDDEENSEEEEEEEEGEEEDDDIDNEEEDIDDDVVDEKELTPFEKATRALQKELKKLENASVESKPWHLRGEVSGFSRPKDSLVEQDEIEHDLAVRPKSVMDMDVNSTLEEMIKQRIADGIFDDITASLPREDDDGSGRKKKKSSAEEEEISQEKSKEGLADVYAREYDEMKEEEEKKRMMKSGTVEKMKDMDEMETAQQKEVNQLYKKIGQRLDSLCNLHFTPLSVTNEKKQGDMDVVKLSSSSKGGVVKAINAEEVIPDSTSDGDMLGAREVFSVDKREEKGEKEESKQERRAKRRRNKSRARKRQDGKQAEEKNEAMKDKEAMDNLRGQRIAEGKDKRNGIVSGAIDGSKMMGQGRPHGNDGKATKFVL